MRTIAHRRQQNDGVQADRFVPQSDDAQPQRATRRAAELAIARSIFDSDVMVLLGPAAPARTKIWSGYDAMGEIIGMRTAWPVEG